MSQTLLSEVLWWGINIQTSVVIPARMTCFLPVASTAARNSGLSQALTSPFLRIYGALGYILTISLGKGPLGPAITYQNQSVSSRNTWTVPVSADVVKMVGRLNKFPNAAWASMLFRNSVGVKSLTIWDRPICSSTTRSTAEVQVMMDSTCCVFHVPALALSSLS